MREKVYLAGTDDVKWVFEKLYDILIGFSFDPLWFHKKFPISTSDTMEECIKNVKKSDRLILVLNKKYGLPSRNQKISITEEEFLTAYKKSCPILVFILSETFTQAKTYHSLIKQKKKVTSKTLKEIGLKADKKLYEFIERIQHLKKNNKTKICWIEPFNFISEIINQIKFKWDLSEFIQFNKFIAPWVLPNEEIPLHITWDQDFEYDYIKIEFQRDLKFSEIINVRKYNIKNSTITIQKSQIRHLSGEDKFPNYIGIVLIYENLEFKQLKLFKDILFTFNKNSKVKQVFTLTAKIFRPELRNITENKRITINDEKLNYSVPINLECTGFGFISIYIKVKINKITLSFKESIFERIEKKIKKKYGDIFEKFDKDEIEEKLKTSKDSVEHFLNALSNYTLNQSNEKPSVGDYLSEENVELSFIFDFFMELIKEIKIQNKFENIELTSPNLELPKDRFNEFIKSLIVFIHYEDLKGNKYTPLEIPLEINDIRNKPQNSIISFNIRVNDIIDNSYHNIENIKRD